MERRRERLRYRRELNLCAPPAMIAAATERRLAGDWRGACAAALVEVDLDLRAVASSYGAAHAERIEAELTGFAPDLLRRFLPRSEGRLVPRATVVLSRFDEPCRGAREGTRRHGPVLVATHPRSWQVVRQAVTLRVVHKLPTHFYDLPEWTWRADAGPDRRWVYGAGPDRLPWHFADGSPYPQGTVTPPEQAADRTGEIERIAAALAAGRPVEAFELAGFEVDRTPTHHYGPELTKLLARMGRALPVARAELLRLAHRYEQERFRAQYGLVGVTRFTVRRQDYSRAASGPWMFEVPAPAETSLLRFGDIGPDELHPLVHEALFPDRVQQWRAQVPHVPEPIRVRCGTDWHTVVATGGHLRTPHHGDADAGGPMSGCAAAVRGWRTGVRPMPKDVRKDRQALFALALHGDSDGLLARLADGLDPALRGPGGGTLLHWLAHLDHERLLPVLLGAGLSLEDRDHEGRTALHAAAESSAEATMAALIAAGADPHARDQLGRTPARVLAEVRGS
ncbi:ankyrin repeat domain-containing protein [Actinoplanes sp. NPDC048967]|uniref:ankyrin repeat domain-containing protein n=1 Tax=Actinoplanes sp. NPDC048967 TaxID=3155269 RepID=UPI0033E18F95